MFKKFPLWVNRFHWTLIYFLLALSFVTGYFFAILLNIEWCSQVCCTRTYYPNSKEVQNSLQMKDDSNKLQKNTTIFVIVIFSSLNNKERREIIRNTWLKAKSKFQIYHYFVLGTNKLPSDKVREIYIEQKHYGDLLLLPAVTDNYRYLTNKLISTITWLDSNLNFNFMMKVDDDTFVRLDLLYSELLMKPAEKLYWGFFDGRAHVKKYGPWSETDWFLCDTYLPYAKGGGYVISSDIVHFIASSAKYLKMYISEDVSLGTWTAPLNIQRIHDPRYDTEYKSRGCSNSYIVTHKQSVQQMKEKYNNLKAKGFLCSKEVKYMNSYMYNWKTVPSKCCIRNDTRIP